MRTALLVGSTGLVGSALLNMLLSDSQYSKVIAVSRTPLTREHPNLVNVVTDFKNLASHEQELTCDDVFCCLGTTMRIAKSKEAFREVDFAYPIAVAKIAQTHGATQYLLVSALGANRDSPIFYNEVKGQTEEAIASLSFKSTHIFRPSLLVGPREEYRPGEEAAKTFYKLFGFLIPMKYKSIAGEQVARAMLTKAKEQTPGTFIHESKDLQKY